MPADNPILQPQYKQYAINVRAKTQFTGVAPVNPRRVFLCIQNRGMHPTLIKFGDPIVSKAELEPGDGSEFELQPGDFLKFENPDTCPKERINVFLPYDAADNSFDSVALSVLEGTI